MMMDLFTTGNSDAMTEQLSSNEMLPFINFKCKANILEEYGIPSDAVEPWSSLWGRPVPPEDVKMLSTTIEFVFNKSHIQEDLETHGCQKRSFLCTTCQGFHLIFSRRSSQATKSDPFFLRSVSHHTDRYSSSVAVIPSRDVLANHPLFMKLLRETKLSTGKFPPQKAVIQHFGSHGIDISSLSQPSFSRLVRDVEIKFHLSSAEEYIKLPMQTFCGHMLRTTLHPLSLFSSMMKGHSSAYSFLFPVPKNSLIGSAFLSSSMMAVLERLLPTMGQSC
jgi:hypothetical protein